MIAALQILLVDDNAQDREALRRALQQDPEATYALEERPTLEEAIEALGELRFDCVLLDHHLPDGSGLELMQEIYRLFGPESIPVVMMTGTGSEAIAVEALKSGVHDYLVKGQASAPEIARAIRGAIFKVRTHRLLNEQRSELERLYREVSESSRRKDQLLADLQLAKDAAERASAAKDEFLATLSHELRTPLTPILTAVSGLDPTALSREELRRTFAMIRRNIALEARLIEDLLDLTRITHGKLHLEMHPVDLHDSLRHAVEICRGDIESKNLQVLYTLQASEHQASGDPARLQQVFWNALANAVKFTPAGGVIHVRTQNDASRSILIEIRDSGIGVEPSQLTAIFRAFEQGRGARRRSGLGLGLTIAKALVEAQHGSIFATSDGPGLGTTIHITLPTISGAPKLQETTVPPGGAVESRAYHLLVVEDDRDTAEFMTLVLEKRGYRVTVAHSRAEALAAFGAHEFDAVLSDIGLPDGSGQDLIRELRARRPIPAIALSGYGMEQDVAASRAAGFDEHVTKPATITALDAALGRLLGVKSE